MTKRLRYGEHVTRLLNALMLGVGGDAHTYASFDPAFAWIDARAPGGNRVG